MNTQYPQADTTLTTSTPALHVVMYDFSKQDSQRNRKNADAIRTALNYHGSEVAITEVIRGREFPGATSVESIFLSGEPFPYRGFLCNTLAQQAQHAIEAVQLAFDEAGIPYSRIICLDPNGRSGQTSEGIWYVPVKGGNGHLLPEDAIAAADLLRQILLQERQG